LGAAGAMKSPDRPPHALMIFDSMELRALHA
jgi:hypothetical protein